VVTSIQKKLDSEYSMNDAGYHLFDHGFCGILFNSAAQGAKEVNFKSNLRAVYLTLLYRLVKQIE
jgi:hypothetical protein